MVIFLTVIITIIITLAVTCIWYGNDVDDGVRIEKIKLERDFKIKLAEHRTHDYKRQMDRDWNSHVIELSRYREGFDDGYETGKTQGIKLGKMNRIHVIHDRIDPWEYGLED